MPEQPQRADKSGGRKAKINYLLGFALGAVVVGGVAMVITQGKTDDELRQNAVAAHSDPGVAGRRTVADLAALSDEELERVDVVEMNVSVAREIPGLENLDYARYRRTVDGWTAQFRRWLPMVEHNFHRSPEAYKNDIHFFRLGMLAQFLDRHVGIAYVEDQKQAQVASRKAGRKAEVRYTDPGHLLLHGLIDTKRGTCGTMPALHVAIGRRLGWPVGLACVNSHYVCRYDDGQVVYNIEATDTGRGGFAEGSDKDYIETEGVSRRAIAVGSDLRKLTAREMLGVFIQSRARHFQDIGKPRLAARDYALAHTLFPKSRKIYVGLVGNLLPVGEKLFAGNEFGHPYSLSRHLSARYMSVQQRQEARRRRTAALAAQTERINAENQARMRRLMQPPTPPRPYRPPMPGDPQPYPSHQPR